MASEFYCAVNADTSRHFNQKIFKTKQAHPGAFLSVQIDPSVPKGEVLRHLELIKSWLLIGEDVQSIHPDTFFLELEKIPRLRVYKQGKAGKEKHWRGRYPKGKPTLI